MKKKKKCTCSHYPYECDATCPRHFGLSPYYGKGDGKSDAAISTATAPTGTGPAFPGAGGINAPGVPSGPNSGMGPVSASRELSGRALLEDAKLISGLCESVEQVMDKLAKKYFDTRTKYVIKNKNLRSGYVAGYEVGQALQIERGVMPKKNDIPGNFLERQVNLSVPKQRIQTALKVKSLIYDVLDGTLVVNGSMKDTAEFKKWAKEMIDGMSR